MKHLLFSLCILAPLAGYSAEITPHQPLGSVMLKENRLMKIRLTFSNRRHCRR